MSSISTWQDGIVYHLLVWYLVLFSVLTTYETPWNHLKKGIDVNVAKEQLKKFFMGKHLTHAPKDYLKSMTLKSLFILWREPEQRRVAYNTHISRGML